MSVRHARKPGTGQKAAAPDKLPDTAMRKAAAPAKTPDAAVKPPAPVKKPAVQKSPATPGLGAASAAPAVGLGVQRKTEVGQPNDPFEKQAEDVAQRVSAGEKDVASGLSGGADTAKPPEEPAPPETESDQATGTEGDQGTTPAVQTAPATKPAASAPAPKKPPEPLKPPAPGKQPGPEAPGPAPAGAVQRAGGPPADKVVKAPPGLAAQRKALEPGAAPPPKPPEEHAAAPPSGTVQRAGGPPADKEVKAPPGLDVQRREAAPKPPKKAEPHGAAPAAPAVMKAPAAPSAPEHKAQPEQPKTPAVQKEPAGGGGAAGGSAGGASGGGAAGAGASAGGGGSAAGSGADAGSHLSAVADSAIVTAGAGEPLWSGTRDTLESGLGADLSGVRVHEGGGAAAAARGLEARAFTHGRDIWLGPGESQADIPLMAHEATHVLQQDRGLARRMVQPARRRRGGGRRQQAPATPEEAERELHILPLPRVKQRHRTVYEAWASSGRLKRLAGYDRGEPNQISVWQSQVEVNESAFRHLHLDPNSSEQQHFKTPAGQTLNGTYSSLRNQAKIPIWDRHNHAKDFQVDHIVELQVASWGEAAGANTIQNMELLDGRSNASAGASLSSGIRRKVRNLLRARDQPSGRDPVNTYLAANDIIFNSVGVGGGRRGEGASSWWTRDEIQRGVHLRRAEPAPDPRHAGGPTSFALLSPGGGVVLGTFRHGRNALSFSAGRRAATQVAGLKIHSFTLNANYSEERDNSPIGTASAEWDVPSDVHPTAGAQSVPILKAPGNRYAGYLGTLQPPSGHFDLLSAVQFDAVSFENGMLTAQGRLTPSIPLFRGAPLTVRLRGGAFEFGYIYNAGEINLPIPGVTIDDSSLGVFYGSDGLSVSGRVDFSVRQLGQGSLEASVGRHGFEATGNFSFDTRLFDRADMSVWYRGGAFGASGTLGIDTPNKIKGIRSAEINARFENGAFHADGTVQPSIPGVQQAGLTVGYSEEHGLTIGGNLQIANVPGIASGSVDVTVNKRPDGRWVVQATGTAVPAIPGISSTINVTYDDGAFDIAGTVGYERGMLSGSVTVGATNRPIGPDGRPAGPPPPHGGSLTLYGGGSVSLRLAPWLQATAAIRLLPNGEVEVTGRIGLPDALDLFPAKNYDKNIFSIGLDIPIVGVAVAGQRIGIFATISGGLDVSAGIGPGQLRQLSLEVTYNPAHEDQTHVTGGAQLYVPARAGLRLFVRGGLGAGIPIVSAQAGIEIGGGLGLEGAAQADVQVDWMPNRGLQLDASASIFVEPKLKFDITGYVTVEADLLFTTIDLYSKRWRLAGFEYGSGLRFGVRFPVHYREGQPFDLSLDDIQFIVPHIEPNSLLRNLMKRLA